MQQQQDQQCPLFRRTKPDSLAAVRVNLKRAQDVKSHSSIQPVMRYPTIFTEILAIRFNRGPAASAAGSLGAIVKR